MKNKCSFILSILIFLTFVFFDGCQKAPMNGNLDGQWEVMEVYPQPEVVLKERLYYNFYMHVCQLTYYGGYLTNGNMTFDGEILQLDFPYRLTEEQEKILRQFGIGSHQDWFIVDFPSKHQMILSNEKTTIVLRKF